VAAVSDRVETLPVYARSDYDVGATLDPEWASLVRLSKQQEVVTRTVTEIIDGTTYRDQPIDLLSIDAERFDLKVLRGLDFSRYRPGFVLTELVAPVIEHVLRSEVHGFLDAQGYVLRNWVGPTLFYQSRATMDPAALAGER
jgi:hypothetical protein